MHLELVTETFPPEINGVAMTLGQLSEGLAHRGHRLTIIRPNQGKGDRPRTDGLYAEELTPGAPIPGYPFLRLGLPVRGRLLRRWQQHRPDLVHIATEGPLGYAALLAATRLRLPISSSYHTHFHQYGRHYGAGFLTKPALAYLRHFHNRTRITLSPTATLNAELARSGFRGVRLLARGVDTRCFTPAARSTALRTTWGAGPADPVAIHVSRLAPEKNYALLERCWAAMAAANPRTRFVLVSDGPLRRKLQRHFPQAHFTGFLSRSDLATHYASADLFVYPSETETFGNVVTEALASGLAVAAYDYAAANRFLRNGENGLAIPFGDETALIAAGLRLVNDAELRGRLGAAARATALTIPWDEVIDGFERDLREVAGEPSPLAVRRG